MDVPGIDLAKAKEDLEKMTTVQQRVHYFANEGRPLLNAFAAIVSNTRAINSAAMFHTEARNIGISTGLRDEKGLRSQRGNAPVANQERESNVVQNPPPAPVSPEEVPTLPLAQLERLANSAQPSEQRDVAIAELRARLLE